MTLALIVLNFLLAMLANCVTAWSMSKIWAWFCEASLGAGPTIGAWFGISLILGMVVTGNTLNVARSERQNGDSWAKPVGLILGSLMLLGMAWCMGTLLGWKA